MYDRRPASRVARGTPTVAAFTTPILSVVVRGSLPIRPFLLLCGGERPRLALQNISWMPEGTSSETRRELNGHSSTSRRTQALTPLSEPRLRCDSASMSLRVAAAFFRRLLRPLIVIWAALISAPASAAAQQPQRIVAVGDLHGDGQAWLTIARAAGVIDARGHWSGGKTVLVQLGDITDREPNSLRSSAASNSCRRKRRARAGGSSSSSVTTKR